MFVKNNYLIQHYYSKDNFYDYMPFVSSYTNYVKLFKKLKAQNKNNEYYLNNLKNTNSLRCIILLFPVAGNLIICIYDFILYFFNKYRTTKEKQAEQIIFNLLKKNIIKFDNVLQEKLKKYISITKKIIRYYNYFCIENDKKKIDETKNILLDIFNTKIEENLNQTELNDFLDFVFSFFNNIPDEWKNIDNKNLLKEKFSNHVNSNKMIDKAEVYLEMYIDRIKNDLETLKLNYLNEINNLTPSAPWLFNALSIDSPDIKKPNDLYKIMENSIREHLQWLEEY